MNKILSPSIMCADLKILREEITELNASGADMFHIDIMDGEFVPNTALSLRDYIEINAVTDKPLDVHLMVKNPGLYLPYLFKYGARIIYIHYESGNVADYLHEIRGNGIEAGLAVNPDTGIDEFQPLLPLVDWLLVMRTQPGFSGRPPVPEVDDKLHRLAQINDRKFKIAIDGAVCPETIEKWIKLGVNKFILGTASGLFGVKRNGKPYADVIRELRGAVHINDDKKGKSPLEDIPYIKADITTQEIVDLIRESRAGI